MVSLLIQQRKDLQNPLGLYKEILQIQLEIDNTPTKGTNIKCDDQNVVDDLQRKSLDAKKPIIHFLDPHMFNLDVSSKVSKKVVRVLIEQNVNKKGLEKLLSYLESGRLDILKLVEAALREDIVSIGKVAEESGVQPALLLFTVGALIQPCLERIAGKSDPSLLDKWWQATCPVCGRIPAVARLKHNKRYLVCTFCGAEYLSDHFSCVHCGNKDPYTLKYLAVEAQPAFQIDFCTKCKRYIKVINEAKLKDPIPKGLEDILTLNLDFSAKEADLIRETDHSA
ncbi:MAG: formate dehydrogenase accessory protein FdhE [Candidatus Bathyarchaeota archaeon]|nr:MAG: formate dehydrogenase accessory protein FdhE [Candidatus Bathyarchaeota archaeon]